jgi:nucleoside-diphosphate-sugar epimerase
MKKIYITGANGFIGKALCKTLSLTNKSIKGIVRKLDKKDSYNSVDYLEVGDLTSNINLSKELVNCECIIHCAGLAHSMNKKNNLNYYRLVNTELSKNIAEQAVIAGVKRFIFLSSVKVNGENTGNTGKRHIFKNSDLPDPQDYYAISKYEAEKALFKIVSKTNLELVIIRIPLVYGYGAKGNLDQLIKLISYKIPLPLGSIKNKRSLIGIDNLVHLLVRCIEHPNAAGKIFLVSDGKDISTTELVELIASAMNQKVKLFKLSNFLLKLISFIIGKHEEMSRLLGSLRVDNEYTSKELDWYPPISIEEGIRRMVSGK